MISFPTVGKYTDAGDDLDSARFAKAVAAHVSNHFPGTLRLDQELPATKEVHPDDLPYSQVAHGLGLSPLPVAASPQRVEDKNQAVPFDFQGNPVRTVVDENGNPWFVAKDVCDILGYADAHQAVKQNCKYPKLFKTVSETVLKIPPRGVLIVNEPDLYRLITRSTLPAAERFEAWVMEEVLPAIRKHGAYMTPQTIENVLDDPDLVIGLATKLKEERAKAAELEAQKAKLAQENAYLAFAKQELQAENEALSPKAEIYDAFMDSTGTIEIDGAAKLLQKNFPWIGPQKLWNLLKRRGVILKNRDPKQYHLKAGYFRSIVRDEDHERAEKYGYEPYRQTRVTPNGMVFMHRFLRSEERMMKRNLEAKMAKETLSPYKEAV